MPSPSAPTPLTLRETLDKLASGVALTRQETSDLFAEIMTGAVPPETIAKVLLTLRARGETAAELAGAVTALRAVMRRVEHSSPAALVDTCGTGGGEVTTLNISTAAAFVAAGAGVTIAKHGNRSFTSRSGSADVLEALGVGVNAEPDAAAATLRDVGLVFLFAPIYHPAMRHVGPVRKQLGVPTIMNIVGPLANPASVGRQIIGVADEARVTLVAGALRELGTIHSWVVRGDIGIDEISPVGMTTILKVRDGEIHEVRLDPAAYGLAAASLDGLEGGEPAENARRILDLFEQPDAASPAVRSAVLLNAAAAILVSGRVDTFGAAVEAAQDALREGKARGKLEMLRHASPAPVSTS